jgi:hypothetical protein
MANIGEKEIEHGEHVSTAPTSLSPKGKNLAKLLKSGYATSAKIIVKDNIVNSYDDKDTVTINDTSMVE